VVRRKSKTVAKSRHFDKVAKYRDFRGVRMVKALITKALKQFVNNATEMSDSSAGCQAEFLVVYCAPGGINTAYSTGEGHV